MFLLEEQSVMASRVAKMVMHDIDDIHALTVKAVSATRHTMNLMGEKPTGMMGGVAMKAIYAPHLNTLRIPYPSISIDYHRDQSAIRLLWNEDGATYSITITIRVGYFPRGVMPCDASSFYHGGDTSSYQPQVHDEALLILCDVDSKKRYQMYKDEEGGLTIHNINDRWAP